MASELLIGSNNYVITGTLVAGSEVAGLGAENLQTDQCTRSRGWQTGVGDITAAGGATLRVTFPTTTSTVRVAGLFNTNLTATADVTFTIFDVSDVQVATLTVSNAVVPDFNQVVAVFPANYVGAYMDIDIDDGANPDNYIGVGGAFVGPAWNPAINFSFDSDADNEVTQSEVVSRGGQEWVSLLSFRRVWNMRFGDLRETETWTDLQTLQRLASLGGNILVIPDKSSTYLQRQAVFGRLRSRSPVGWPKHTLEAASWAATISERL